MQMLARVCTQYACNLIEREYMWSIGPETLYRFTSASPTSHTCTVASQRVGVLYQVSL